jgi:hypothetical protein
LVWRVERIGGPYVQVLRGFYNVDRFFSKLDLRDIKIDPFNASYPPDAEEAVEADTGHGVETEVAAQPAGARQPHTPAWATATEVGLTSTSTRKGHSALRNGHRSMARSPRPTARRWSSTATATS